MSGSDNYLTKEKALKMGDVERPMEKILNHSIYKVSLNLYNFVQKHGYAKINYDSITDYLTNHSYHFKCTLSLKKSGG